MILCQLFSGIGAQAQGLKDAGIPFEAICCEIDAKAHASYEAIHGPTPNLGDITKVEHLPECDLLTWSFPCLRGDQVVSTMRGPVPIKNVVVGDEVLTHEGRFRKVTAVRMTGFHGVMRVKTPVNTLVCTRDHMVLTRFKLKSNGHPRKSDGIIGRTFTPAYWAPAISLTHDNYVGYPVNTVEESLDWDAGEVGGKGHTVSIKDKLSDASFWWLCGRYVADGWLRTQGGITIALGKGKEGDVEKLESAFHVSCARERTVLKAHIPLQKLGKFCDEMFGHGASEKHIDRRVLNLPCNLLRAFLEGYVSGDGHLCDDGSIICSSVSERLIRDLQEAVIKVYHMVPKYSFTKRPETTAIEGRVVHQQDSHCLRWKAEARKQDKSFYEDGILWHPVKETESLGPCNTYDISVEEDHSFVANGVIVHNCQDLSIASPDPKGMVEGTGTRSSLCWEVIRLLRDAEARGSLPRDLVMENVPAVTAPRNRPVFDALCAELEAMGYTNSWAILNAKDYGVPQNRRRCFMVSSLRGAFIFPAPCPDGRVLRDVLVPAEEVPEKYWLKPERLEGLMRSTAKQSAKGNGFKFEPTDGSGIAHTVTTRNGSRKTDNFICDGGCMQVATLAGKGHDCIKRIYSPEGMSPTVVTAAGGGHIPKAEIVPGRIRKLLPIETFRLQGFPDEAFRRVQELGLSDTQLYKQAGNSIAVPCLTAIFKAMREQYPPREE